VIDEALRQVQAELAAAHEELRLACDIERVANARYMGLVTELVDLCKAKMARDAARKVTP
jgi:hypothetical protein